MDILNPSSDFEYEALDGSKGGMRLLRLIITETTRPPYISCNLVKRSLSSNSIYKALSYRWGQANSLADRWILVNRGKFRIRENLYYFLKTVDDNDTFFWIDQIRINQSDVHERNHQVQLMSRIYSCASKVVAWLGPATADCDIAMMAIVEEVIAPKERDIIPKVGSRTVKPLFQMEYWKRLWLIQEILLAQSIIAQCGRRTLSWQILEGYFHTPSTVRALQGKVYFNLRSQWGFPYTNEFLIAHAREMDPPVASVTHLKPDCWKYMETTFAHEAECILKISEIFAKLTCR